MYFPQPWLWHTVDCVDSKLRSLWFFIHFPCPFTILNNSFMSYFMTIDKLLRQGNKKQRTRSIYNIKSTSYETLRIATKTAVNVRKNWITSYHASAKYAQQERRRRLIPCIKGLLQSFLLRVTYRHIWRVLNIVNPFEFHCFVEITSTRAFSFRLVILVVLWEPKICT